MIRSNVELPRVPVGWPDGTSGGTAPSAPDGAPADNASADDQPPLVRMASTLDYDGATHQLTLTRGDGTVQQFPANNNPDSTSGGRWQDGTYGYERHTTHPNDAPDSKFGSNGNYIFTVPGRPNMGVHSGRENVNDAAGRSGVDHATFGCIRTTDDGTSAIHDAMTSGDPITSITVRNNR